MFGTDPNFEMTLDAVCPSKKPEFKEMILLPLPLNPPALEDSQELNRRTPKMRFGTPSPRLPTTPHSLTHFHFLSLGRVPAPPVRIRNVQCPEYHISSRCPPPRFSQALRFMLSGWDGLNHTITVIRPVFPGGFGEVGRDVWDVGDVGFVVDASGLRLVWVW